jgi:hypothetical protein
MLIPILLRGSSLSISLATVIYLTPAETSTLAGALAAAADELAR